MPLTFGKPRYYRPVCVLYSGGFLGGPACYLEVDDSSAGYFVLVAGADIAAAWRRGEVTLAGAREPDQREQ